MGRARKVADMVPLGNDMTVPKAVNDAIELLTNASDGLSRTSVVRQVLLVGLQSLGVIDPTVAESVPPTAYGRKKTA